MFVDIPGEIQEYEKKVLKMLSLRQLVWLLLGVITAVVFYLLLY